MTAIKNFGDERLPHRFWSKVEPNDGGCWVWVAAHSPEGYGRFHLDGTRELAHRVVYSALVGPIPTGLQIDHLCRNPACVNPAHLEPVSSRENTMRGGNFAAINAAKTHCSKGHPFAGDNLYIIGGHRFCRICARRISREHYLRKKQSLP